MLQYKSRHTEKLQQCHFQLLPGPGFLPVLGLLPQIALAPGEKQEGFNILT